MPDHATSLMDLPRTIAEADAVMREIAQDVGTVSLCVSERDLVFNRENVIDAVPAAHRAGLQVFIDPWGAFGIFGGEHFSGYLAGGGKACLKEPSFIEWLMKYISLAVEAGADGMFWDEPHLSCGCCSTYEFIKLATRRAKAVGLQNEVCTPPFGLLWRLLKKVADLAGVDIISSNAYYDIPGFKHRYKLPHVQVTAVASRLASIGRQSGKKIRLWISLFKKIEMAGYEHVLMRSGIKIIADAASAAGVTSFATWAHGGCESVSSLWPNGRREQCAEVQLVASQIFHRT